MLGRGWGKGTERRLVLRRLQAQRLLGLVHRRRVAVRHREPASQANATNGPSRGASDASSAWETVEPTPKPRRTAREASATKRVPRTVDEEDSWEASPQHPGDRHRRRRSVSQAVTQARWASPASDLTDSPSAAWSGTHLNE